MDQDKPMSGGLRATTGGDSGTANRGDVCPTCGASKNANLEQFLGRLGINEEMISRLKSQMQNVDVEEYLNTARDYLKTGSDKASRFAKENPGKVAAGLAALAVGAGLLISSRNRD
jgi:hypothetical protein